MLDWLASFWPMAGGIRKRNPKDLAGEGDYMLCHLEAVLGAIYDGYVGGVRAGCPPIKMRFVIEGILFGQGPR